jgi:hypothetical protein
MGSLVRKHLHSRIRTCELTLGDYAGVYELKPYHLSRTTFQRDVSIRAGKSLRDVWVSCCDQGIRILKVKTKIANVTPEYLSLQRVNLRLVLSNP